MSNSKISALTSATTPLAGTEVLPVVQSSTTKQVSVANLTAGRAVSASSLTLTTALAATSGGTGNTSAFTSNGMVYASSTTVLATGSAITFDGTNFATTGSATATGFIPSSSTVPTNGLFLPATNAVGIATNSTERFRIASTGQYTFTAADMTGASPSVFQFSVTAKAAQTGTTSGVITSMNTDATYVAGGVVRHFIANQATFTVAPTTQAGFYANSTLTGATNNYGFQGTLASGTGVFNLYMNGTASNYLAGNLLLGTTTQPTTSNNIVVAGLNATSAAAPTIASATTIAPTKQITFISGTTAIATITAPNPISTGGGQITLIPTGLFTTTTAGNIALASIAVVNKALIMTYDTTTAKWYPSY